MKHPFLPMRRKQINRHLKTIRNPFIIKAEILNKKIPLEI
jgi:hypothetical protein